MIQHIFLCFEQECKASSRLIQTYKSITKTGEHFAHDCDELIDLQEQLKEHNFNFNSKFIKTMLSSLDDFCIQLKKQCEQLIDQFAVTQRMQQLQFIASQITELTESNEYSKCKQLLEAVLNTDLQVLEENQLLFSLLRRIDSIIEQQNHQTTSVDLELTQHRLQVSQNLIDIFNWQNMLSSDSYVKKSTEELQQYKIKDNEQQLIEANEQLIIINDLKTENIEDLQQQLSQLQNQLTEVKQNVQIKSIQDLQDQLSTQQLDKIKYNQLEVKYDAQTKNIIEFQELQQTQISKIKYLEEKNNQQNESIQDLQNNLITLQQKINEKKYVLEVKYDTQIINNQILQDQLTKLEVIYESQTKRIIEFQKLHSTQLSKINQLEERNNDQKENIKASQDQLKTLQQKKEKEKKHELVVKCETQIINNQILQDQLTKLEVKYDAQTKRILEFQKLHSTQISKINQLEERNNDQNENIKDLQDQLKPLYQKRKEKKHVLVVKCETQIINNQILQDQLTKLEVKYDAQTQSMKYLQDQLLNQQIIQLKNQSVIQWSTIHKNANTQILGKNIKNSDHCGGHNCVLLDPQMSLDSVMKVQLIINEKASYIGLLLCDLQIIQTQCPTFESIYKSQGQFTHFSDGEIRVNGTKKDVNGFTFRKGNTIQLSWDGPCRRFTTMNMSTGQKYDFDVDFNKDAKIYFGVSLYKTSQNSQIQIV